MSEKHKPYLVVLALAVIALSAVAIAYALIPWIQNISWDIENQSFSVNKPTDLPLGTIPIGNVTTITYTITNTGNVPITIHASTSGLGFTAVWNKTEDTIANNGDTATFILTLTVTGAGSCTVTFS